MANPTTNFNWQMPTSTDLVTDLPADFETFGQAVDTSLAELKGGTTGQVLSKTSNTDMDFTWVTTDDANAIQNSIVDAKGDIVAASANDTPARLAVGNNGETLVADSSTATGLRYQAIQAAGRNVLINSDFRINQRSTGLSTTSTTFIVDRFSLNYSGGSCSGEQKTFSPGGGISGISSVEHYLEYISSGQSGTSDQLRCRGAFEDIYAFTGETVTFSFYAKAASGTPKIAVGTTQNFGSGGSATVTAKAGEVTLSTSWARYSITFTMPSISGKTIGAGAYNTIQFFMSAGTALDGGIWGIGVQNNTFQFTAWQLEQGSVATPFTTATGTFQGELAACQRYLPAIAASNGEIYAGQAYSTTAALIPVVFPVTARVAPTGITVNAAGNFRLRSAVATKLTTTAINFSTGTVQGSTIEGIVAAGLVAGNATNLFNESSGTILFTGCEL